MNTLAAFALAMFKKYLITLAVRKGGDMLKNWVIERLKERSTWRGIVLVCTAMGATLSPEQGEAVMVAGLGLTGLLGAFTKDGAKGGV